MKTLKVKLLKDHEHQGRRHPAGAEIEVAAHQAAWLAEHNIIKTGAAGKKED